MTRPNVKSELLTLEDVGNVTVSITKVTIDNNYIRYLVMEEGEKTSKKVYKTWNGAHKRFDKIVEEMMN